MLDKTKAFWEYLQGLLDIKSGTVMAVFTGVVIVRLLAVLKGSSPITLSEAAVYSTCVAAFGYSNGGTK